jgi:hypothetical protein
MSTRYLTKSPSSKIVSTLGLAFLLSALTANAFAGDSGFQLKASTLGLGLEADYKISDHFGARLQLNALDYDDDFEEDDINYTGSIDFSTTGLLLDYHPFKGGFRLSAGLFSNGNEINATATGEGEYEIGDFTYLSSSEDPVEAQLSVELGEGMAPFLGFCWGNSPKREKGFMISFDVGVLFSGSPSVDFSVAGTATERESGRSVDLSTDTTVQENVAIEIQILEDDISGFEVYPVISLGLGYRF